MKAPWKESIIGEVVIPSVSFSLAAIVRVRNKKDSSFDQKRTQDYVLVHEKPPRGWWLPGGGIEHHDKTPVHAAIRETVEEAGAPSLLEYISNGEDESSSSWCWNSKQEVVDGAKMQLLPSMTHLISLEQSPGRIRFIFRGEWVDNSDDHCDRESSTPQSSSILKQFPGDKDSIEATWITWNEIQHLKKRKPRRRDKSASNPKGTGKIQSMSDSWLRGHEPLTFFGILEQCHKENRTDPGLAVHMMSFTGGLQSKQEDKVIGAFFGRKHSGKPANTIDLITSHGRAAMLTHLECRLVIYDKDKNEFAIDSTTEKIPHQVVRKQNIFTLRQLVDKMMEDTLLTLPCDDSIKDRTRHKVGLLRVQYIINENGRDATLTVFPLMQINGDMCRDKATQPGQSLPPVSEENASDSDIDFLQALRKGDKADGIKQSTKAAARDASSGADDAFLSALRGGSNEGAPSSDELFNVNKEFSEALHVDSPKDKAVNIVWVSGEELSDRLERKLAAAVTAEHNGNWFCNLQILKDDEGPL